MTDDNSQSDTWERFRSKMWLAEGDFDNCERDIDKIEPAWARAALGFRTGKRIGHLGENRAQSLRSVHAYLDVFNRDYGCGDTLALLRAVASCADENLPLPIWLATAFNELLNKFLTVGGPESLDCVFHSKTLPTATPKKAATARQDWTLGSYIWSAVWETAIDNPQITSIDLAVKKALSEHNFGVKLTKAKRLFLMIDKNQTKHTSGKTLSRFLEIRRKQFT